MNIYIHETAKANVPYIGLDFQVKGLDMRQPRPMYHILVLTFR